MSSLKYLCDDTRTVAVGGIEYRVSFSVYRDYSWRARYGQTLRGFEITDTAGERVHVDEATFAAVREECRILRKREYKARCRKRNERAQLKAAQRREGVR